MRALHRTLLVGLVVLAASACRDDRDPVAPPDAASENRTGVIRPFPYQDFIEITAGDYHTCVRRADRRVYCWGADGYRQAGGMSSSSQLCASGARCVWEPRQVANGAFSAAIQIDAGGQHTCALDLNSNGVCWGAGGIGQLGQQGLSITDSGPVVVSGGHRFTSISAGPVASCATSSNGMYCWGRYPGRPSPGPDYYTAPTLISTYNGYSRVAVGSAHGCGWEAWSGWGSWVDCWGGNTYGQGGFDPSQGSQLPFTIGTATGYNVHRVATQGDFTCVDQGNTTVQCFGRGWEGQLGNAQFVNNHVAQTVGGGLALRGVSTSLWHACALDPNGAAYCWGLDGSGQLGRGVQPAWWNKFANPVAVAMPQGVTFRAIATGAAHSCAIGNDELIYCWGDNSYGQLGRGIYTPDATPWRPLPTWTPKG